jgi:hypothetical protein
MQRGIGAKAGPDLLQPAAEVLLVEWRHDGSAHRFYGKASWLKVGKGMSGRLRPG